MTSFHAEKCCHLVSSHTAFPSAYAAASASYWSSAHSYLFHCLLF